MSKSKHDAAMLCLSAKTGMLGEEVLAAMLVMSGVIPSETISEAGLHKLERLGIGRKDVSILDGQDVFVLSPFGKKVIAVVKDNAKELESALKKKIDRSVNPDE
jgi:hypothetical protein